MTRVGVLLSTIIPSVIAGGFLFGSLTGHADAGRDTVLGAWPAAGDAATSGRAVLVAQADPWRSAAPPAPPMAPAPPVAPGRHRRSGHGISVSIHDGKLELDGIQELVQDQLERVDDILDNVQDLPPGARERIKSRIRAVRGKLRGQLGRLKSVDLDQIGPAMEQMGDEIEREMEGLDKDLSQFGDQFGKSFAQFGKELAKNLSAGTGPTAGPTRAAASRDADRSDDGDNDNDDDGDRDVAIPPGTDASVDPADVRAAIGDLKGVSLDPEQRAKLAQLRANADREIASARRDLEEMSTQLHDSLGDLRANEGDLIRQIDQISAKEASIRKARILAWVRARSMLSKDQRKLIEAAAKKVR